MLKDSFTVIGTPSSTGRSPFARRASAARAWSRARSKSRSTTALRAPSFASMAAMAASQSSRAVASPAATARAQAAAPWWISLAKSVGWGMAGEDGGRGVAPDAG